MAENGYDITLMVDGGSRGNPGPAAIGAVIIQDGREAVRLSECIGEATNNEAEYKALIEGLKRASELDAQSIHVKADSQLIVKQLLGHYKIKSENIRPLHAEATTLLKSYARVGIEHIPRELNIVADSLVNDALDAAAGKPKKKKKAEGKDEPCPKAPGPGPIISFLSDFGTSDAWVAVVKGVIKGICPVADIVDISHEVRPYDTMKGSFVLETAVEHIQAVVHLAVVDPGVGGDRRCLIIRSARGDFLVGPDNGMLVPAANKLGGIAAVYAINEAAICGGPCSTFHARDIFGPVAARLASGDGPTDLAAEMKTEDIAPALYGLAVPEGKTLNVMVIDADRFGTLRFNVRQEDAEAAGFVPGASADVSFADGPQTIPIKSTFRDVPKGAALFLYDSSGYLCVSVNSGHAGLAFDAKPGDNASIVLAE